jgi:sphinganine-1-phosphate aldolase
MVRTIPSWTITTTTATVTPMMMMMGQKSSSWRNDPSVLELSLNGIHTLKAHVSGRLWALDDFLVTALSSSPSSSSSTSSPNIFPHKSIAYYLFLPLWQFLMQLIEDGLGIIMIVGALRIVYCLYHFTYHEWKTQMVDTVFEWSAQHVPYVSHQLEEELKKVTPSMEQSLGKDPNRHTTTRLPAKGTPARELIQQLQQAAQTENKAWQTGKISGAVYQGDVTHSKLLSDTYALYSVANTLHAGMWPKLNQCEAELVHMTANLLHSPSGVGCTSSGGTESILLAIRAHLQYYGKRRGIVHPELICGSTAHAAVDKACEMYDIRKVCIDCSSDGALDYTLDPHRVQEKITSNTIMIYASAPNFPQGTIDPIEDLGALAELYDIGLHVDACLGGFVLPFLRRNVITTNNNSKVAPASSSLTKHGHHDENSVVKSPYPKFDFEVKGVTSMSADTHKFGYAAKGTSVVLYRHNALRHAQYFCYAHWAGGMYGTPTLAGSRPSALIACAWASLMTLGYEGFEQRAHQIAKATNEICQGIAAIDGLYTLNGTQTPSMVVCIGATIDSKMSIYSVGDAMKAKGWHLNNLQHPASLSLCVTLNVAPQANTFLTDLTMAVQEVRAIDNPIDAAKQGTAGIYGMTTRLPEGPVNYLLRGFMDLFLVP